MAIARLVNDEENGCRFEVKKGRKLDTHATYMVNSCQGKVAGVILCLSLNTSIYSGMGCNTSS